MVVIFVIKGLNKYKQFQIFVFFYLGLLVYRWNKVQSWKHSNYVNMLKSRSLYRTSMLTASNIFIRNTSCNTRAKIDTTFWCWIRTVMLIWINHNLKWELRYNLIWYNYLKGIHMKYVFLSPYLVLILFKNIRYMDWSK